MIFNFGNSSCFTYPVPSSDPLVSQMDYFNAELLGGQLVTVESVDSSSEKKHFGIQTRVRSLVAPFREAEIFSSSLEPADVLIYDTLGININSLIQTLALTHIPNDSAFEFLTEQVCLCLQIAEARRALPYILASGYKLLDPLEHIRFILDALKLTTGLSSSCLPVVDHTLSPPKDSSLGYISSLVSSLSSESTSRNVEAFLWNLLEDHIIQSSTDVGTTMLRSLAGEVMESLVHCSNGVVTVESPHPVRTGAITSLPLEIRMCVRLLRDTYQQAEDAVASNRSAAAYDLFRRSIEAVLSRLIGVSNSTSKYRIIYTRSQAALRKAVSIAGQASSTAEKCWILKNAVKAFLDTISSTTSATNDHIVNLQPIEIPGASEILVSFDARSNCCGALSFFTDKDGENKIDWYHIRDDWSAFRVRGSCVWYSFQPGHEPPHDMGKRCVQLLLFSCY
jgi:hypothetical protein